MICAYPTGFLN